MSVPGEDRELPRLTVVSRALGLLSALGASLGLLAWEVRAWHKLAPYVQANELVPRSRQHQVGMMAAGIALALLVGTILVLVRRGRGLDLVSRVAHRTAPLCLAPIVPFLFSWELWVGRDLAFLAVASIFALALQALMRLALASPPVFDIDVARMRLWQRRPLAWLSWPGLPFLIACLAGAFCAAYFGYYTVISHHSVRTRASDLGLEANLVWHAAHLGPLFRTTPLGNTMSLTGQHHPFFAYVIAPVFRLFPRAETMLIVQAVFMGAATIPLFLVARRRVGPWIACLLACLLALYPPFHGAVLSDFHYQPLSTFFLLMSLHLLEVRRNRWAALVIVLTLSLREDVAALVAVIGAYLAVTGRRPRVGLALAVGSAVVFVIHKMIIMPRLFGGVQIFLDRYEGLLPAGATGFGGVLETAVGNPAFTLHGILAPDKLTYLLKILAPLAFLPLRRPLGLLLLLPGFFFTLLATNYPALNMISFQYTAYWTPFVFLAAADALASFRGAEGGAPIATRSLPAWVVAMTLSMLVCSNQYGAIFQHHTAGSGFDQFVFGKNPADEKRHADLYALIAQIPPTASVLASERVVAHVSCRSEAYGLRVGPHQGDFILMELPLPEYEKSHVLDLVGSGKYGLVELRGDFALAKRGAATDRNETLLARVR